MNKLSEATSPYLLQHAHNPVHWNMWNEKTLERARCEDKPIFLSIGYAACHWCHVMAHESFEDEEIARILNEHFISIKVDREERPELDSIYMSATVALAGQGGWPMSVFLTPDLRPFFAGTYFPPVRHYNLPAFREVLLMLAEAYRLRRNEIERVGREVVERLQSNSWSESIGGLDDQLLASAAVKLIDQYDWVHGGWGSAPKFPQPMLVEFLLRQASRGDKKALEAAQHCLHAMARGGMYDVVGGGFARYSVDSLWRVPHFEKMLYDNAQLAQVNLHAWLFTKEAFFKRIALETLDFVAREMTHPEGGFFSSLDADSEAEEGKFYVWTKSEIRNAIGDTSLFELFDTAYGLMDTGNWEGKTVLQRVLDDATLSAKFSIPLEEITIRLSDCHSRLYAVRAGRTRPSTDDKVLTAWNGLMLAALAEAGRFLDQKYTQIAQRNANFLLTSLRPKGLLRRSWRDGKTNSEVYLEDYAALILGLIELFQTDFNMRWFASAVELAEEMIERFNDTQRGGFFDVPTPQSAIAPMLPYRPRDLQDNATPSGNALATEALLKLSAFTEAKSWRDLAEENLATAVSGIKRYPSAFARWLHAGDLAVGPINQATLIGDLAHVETQTLLAEIRSGYYPRLVVAASSLPLDSRAPALLHDRLLIDGNPTVYLCEGSVCHQPITEVSKLRMFLELKQD